MKNYNTEAKSFLDINNIIVSIQYTGFRKYFADDKEERDTYHITLSRNDKSYAFDYGDSISNSMMRKYNTYMDYKYAFYNRKFMTSKLSFEEFEELKKGPDLYSVLCCLASDSYEVGTLQDFCDNFGYDIESHKAMDLYIKLQDASSKIREFFSRDELTFMQDTFQ